ncbi:MAG: HAD family hydrolase [Candidatus Eremiobacteraeota bacterium]|nr:HAD family hydrolase [Candidatus Eremiobacteraeota bacterium]MBV9698534.1 HAD family hydrolase [Candidatus Eremiobacteraeota bacterium]
MERITGIGFDLDHTLAIDNTLERVAFERLLEAVLAQGGRTCGTLTDELDAIDELLRHQRRGDFSVDDAVRRFVSTHGVTPEQRHVAAFRETALGLIDDLVIPLPNVRSTLEALGERGIAMAVLTNGWNPMQVRKARRAGFAGPVLVSSEIGVQKPAAAAFETLLRTLGSAPERSCYVGDDPHGDVAGAHAAGMRAIWVDWEHKTFPSEVAPPDMTVHQFDELLGIVGAPVGAT